MLLQGEIIRGIAASAVRWIHNSTAHVQGVGLRLYGGGVILPPYGGGGDPRKFERSPFR